MPATPPKKTASTPRERLEEFLHLPQEIFDEWMDKIKYLPDTNFKLGREMMRENKLMDAIFRFRMVLWLAPDHQPSWFLLGVCYSMKGNAPKALDALRKSLALKPDHEESLFALANIDPTLLPKGREPKHTPVDLLMDYFNTLAPVYDTQQLELGYRGPVLAWGGLRQHLETFRTNYSVLDLGCGTGLSGLEGEDMVQTMVGVDISRPMLEQANARLRKDGKMLYTQTFNEDIHRYLKDHVAETFEVVLAVHVFGYIGDLSLVFDGVSHILAPGGMMVFQVEPYRGDGFGVLPGRGRFGHSDAYIRSELQRVELELVDAREVPVYPTVPHLQYVVRRPAAADA